MGSSRTGVRGCAPCTALALAFLLVAAPALAQNAPDSTSSATSHLWDEGDINLWVGRRSLTGNGSPAEHGASVGFLGGFRLAGWPVGLDVGFLWFMNQDLTRRADGVYVPPIHGSNVNEVFLGAGRDLPLGGPVHAYAAGGLTLLEADFSDTASTSPPSVTYFGGYVRGALLSRWRYFQLGVGASWVLTPSQWLQVDARRASGPNVGAFVGYGGRTVRDEPKSSTASVESWRWGVELRTFTVANRGSSRDEFTSTLPGPPFGFQDVGYRMRPAFELALTTEPRWSGREVPQLAVAYMLHRMDYGLAESGERLGRATMNAVRVAIDEVTDLEKPEHSSHSYRGRIGFSLGLSWPSDVERGDPGETLVGVTDVRTHTQVLAGIEGSLEARVPRTPIWLGLGYSAALGFGTPPIEMVTSPTSSYRTGYAGFSPQCFGGYVAYRR
jgi:hypothetical protein